jgi:hypothetical protein
MNRTGMLGYELDASLSAACSAGANNATALQENATPIFKMYIVYSLMPMSAAGGTAVTAPA